MATSLSGLIDEMIVRMEEDISRPLVKKALRFAKFYFILFYFNFRNFFVLGFPSIMMSFYYYHDYYYHYFFAVILLLHAMGCLKVSWLDC
jgi:hypothetical protein